jgi:large subunit ribosomal protein L19e
MLKTQRRLAADILKVGEARVWFDPEELESVSTAVTREDIRKLINDGVIQARQMAGVSRYRAKKRHLQKLKGRRKGYGKRKGTKGARFSKKRRWISTIRPIREKLAELRDSRKINKPTYRRLYGMAKGGIFKSKSHLDMYLKEHSLVKK